MPLILPTDARAEKSTGWEWQKKCRAVAPEHKLKVCASFPREQCSAVQGSSRKVLALPFSHWQGLWEIKKTPHGFAVGSWADAPIWWFPLLPCPGKSLTMVTTLFKIKVKMCLFMEWKEEMRETGKLVTSPQDTNFSVFYNNIWCFLKVLNCNLGKDRRNLSEYVEEIECQVVPWIYLLFLSKRNRRSSDSV